MPKLKQVKVEEDFMSWDDVKLTKISRSFMISVPKRELCSFVDQGRKIKEVIIIFE